MYGIKLSGPTTGHIGGLASAGTAVAGISMGTAVASGSCVVDGVAGAAHPTTINKTIRIASRRTAVHAGGSH